jgi:hypothetical protein
MIAALFKQPRRRRLRKCSASGMAKKSCKSIPYIYGSCQLCVHDVEASNSPPVACRAAADAVRAQASQARVAVCRVTALRALNASSRSYASAADACVWLLAD